MQLDEAKRILSENDYLLNEGVREATTKVLEMCDEGILSWQDVAEAALRYMSEDAVADMAREYDWISDLDEDEPEEDEE